jgi:hypothetical protein
MGHGRSLTVDLAAGNTTGYEAANHDARSANHDAGSATCGADNTGAPATAGGLFDDNGAALHH